MTFNFISEQRRRNYFLMVSGSWFRRFCPDPIVTPTLSVGLLMGFSRLFPKMKKKNGFCLKRLLR